MRNKLENKRYLKKRLASSIDSLPYRQRLRLRRKKPLNSKRFPREPWYPRSKPSTSPMNSAPLSENLKEDLTLNKDLTQAAAPAICDCGALIAKTTHASWCSTQV